MIKEFKNFISQGNLVDIAVGFVMGAAFTAIVTSFTTNVFNPFIGMLIPGIEDISSLWTFGEEGSVGAFLAAVINFVLVAVVVFFMVKAYNRMRRKADEAPTDPSVEVVLLTEIRDALRGR